MEERLEVRDALLFSCWGRCSECGDNWYIGRGDLLGPTEYKTPLEWKKDLMDPNSPNAGEAESVDSYGHTHHRHCGGLVLFELRP